jgi:hypothetical protein
MRNEETKPTESAENTHATQIPTVFGSQFEREAGRAKMKNARARERERERESENEWAMLL